MKLILSLLLLQFLAAPLLGAETAVDMGGTQLLIPTPDGFAPVTKDLTNLDQMLEAFVTPDNVRFLSYIPADDLPIAQSGRIPPLGRTLSLQTNKKTVDVTVTTADFVKLKDVVRKQNEELMKEVEQKMPGFVEDADKKLGDQFNTKVDLAFNGMVPYPPHEETERSLAYSIRFNVAAKTADGQPTNTMGYVTATFLHARGKLFFTYVNGGENDLDWTRQVAKDWAAAILAANPPDAASDAAESGQSGWLDWSQVKRSALIGAFVGAAFALVRRLMGGKRAK